MFLRDEKPRLPPTPQRRFLAGLVWGLLLPGLAFAYVGRTAGLIAGAVCLGVVLRTLLAAPSDQRRTAWAAAGGFLIACSVLGAGYVVARNAYADSIARECRQAGMAQSESVRDEQWKAAVHEWAEIEDRYQILLPRECQDVDDERVRFSSTGYCPTWPMPSRPCACGTSRWPDGVKCGSRRPQCTDGRLTCVDAPPSP
jgi:hypothetical protein